MLKWTALSFASMSLLLCLVGCSTTVVYNVEVKDGEGRLLRSFEMEDPDPEAMFARSMGTFSRRQTGNPATLQECVFIAKVFLQLWPDHPRAPQVARAGMLACFLSITPIDAASYDKFETIALNMAFLKEAIRIAQIDSSAAADPVDPALPLLTRIARKGFYHDIAFPRLLKILDEILEAGEDGIVCRDAEQARDAFRGLEQSMYIKWYEDNCLDDLLAALEEAP